MASRGSFLRDYRPPAPPPLHVVKQFGPKCTVFELPDRQGQRMIAGIASTPTVARPGRKGASRTSYLSAGCDVALPVPLLSGHGKDDRGRWAYFGDAKDVQIGEVIYLRRTPHELYIRAIVGETPAGDYAWKLIQSGEVTALSMCAGGDRHMSAIVDGVLFYDRWRLTEISIVREGANPDCKFKIYDPMIGSYDPRVAAASKKQHGFNLARTPPAADVKGRLAAVVVSGLTNSIESLQTRIVALEAGGAKSLVDAYKGPWQEGTRYERGCLITHGGSMWFCNLDTDTRPGAGPEWTLCVKRGRDAR